MGERVTSRGSTGANWLVGPREIVELIRAKDWSATPLGPLDGWPESLRTTVSLCLASSFPINLAWGPGYVQIWNQGYARVCGEKHPGQLGSDFRECWASAWPAIGEAFEAACRGETAYLENQAMFLDRNGYLEETWFTFSFSPIRDAAGRVAGLFHPVTETTAAMLSARRTRSLRDLASQVSRSHSVLEGAALCLDVLRDFALDLPFALLYLRDGDGETARLVGHAGLEPGHSLSPPIIDLLDDAPDAPAVRALRAGESVRVTDLSERFGTVVAGPFPEPIQQAMMLPISIPGERQPIGMLVAGLSARLPLDETYGLFVELVGSGVSNALAAATAYEQQRRRAEALAELDAAKTAFFSNVSHEFRTPLTLLLGPLEDELADLAGSQDRALRRARLETAHRNSLRLLRLVNSLLDFARVESGRIQAIYVPTDLASYTTELASLFRSAVEKAGLTLDVRCEQSAEPVFVDRDMWEKIVLNLLSNAFKYTFSGGITVELKRVAGAVELSVADTGIGIGSDQLPHLFERFHRVTGARARTHEGTGIGLSLVHELVRLHGGDVRVVSEEGRGSVFTLTLPEGSAHLPPGQVGDAEGRADATTVAAVFADEALRWVSAEDVDPALPSGTLAAAGPEPGSSSSRPRVLIADDNADMRAHVARLLEPQFAVTAAVDGAAALEAALAEPPDLVLTDVMMPRLDGFSLLAALRAEERTRTIPVIIVSARAGEEAAVEGLGAGADDYLIKPFSGRELVARVSGNLALARLRHEAANQLESSNRQLAAATQAKSDFLSRMSHELRTPLNAILGFGQLLKLRGAAPAADDEDVAQILKAGDHLLALINEVLDISAVESGRMKISIEPVLAADVIAETLDMVRPLADAQAITLPAIPQEAGSAYVSADRHRLKQVLLNLLANAVKYNVRGGTVDVRCEPTDASRLRIIVTDTGIGVAPSDLARLFMPFERFGAAVSAVEGSGLGLALSKGLVEAMGGTIAATSTLGRGSTFTIELEAVPAPAGAAVADLEQAEPAAPPPRSVRRVLSIEDNPSNIRLIERVLAMRPGTELIVAIQGRLGIDLAVQHDPHLILLDLNLPDLRGDEVLRRLKADPRTANTPVIMISADASPGQLERLRSNGAADYLSKPFDVARLLALVDELTAGAESAVKTAPPGRGREDGPAGAEPAVKTAPAGPTEPDSRPGKRSILTALRERGVPADELDRLATGFLEASEETLARLALSVDDGDLDAVARAGHDLAGSSASFGATRLSAVARKVQGAAEAGDASDARAMLPELANALDEARSTLLN